MHPAKSVIFFTTASGAGYGLLFWLGLLAGLGALADGVPFALAAFVLSLGLVSAGLLASTVHLGHPERAWRALSQWRSSWLSREGVAAVVTYVPAGLFAAGAVIAGFGHPAVIALGLAAALGALATVHCTSMIYASLKAVPAWAGPLTAAGYLALSAFTGALLLHALLRLWGGESAGVAAALALGFLAVSFAVKIAQWSRIDAGASPSSPQSATGLGRFGAVRLLEGPHSAPNYLMKEMGFRIARRHAGALRRLVVIALYFAPAGLSIIALVLGGSPATAVSLIAAASAGVGVAIERWLFFAEARHVVMNYYGGGQRGA